MNKTFGVIVCPECKAAKAVDLTNDTTQCHDCGKRLVLEKMRIHYKTISQEEARWAIGRLNAEMRGGELPEKEDVDENDDPCVKASKEAVIADSERERLEIICRVLGEEMEQFTSADVKEVYSHLGKECEDMEKKLRRLEDVYEPKEGVFRSV